MGEHRDDTVQEKKGKIMEMLDCDFDGYMKGVYNGMGEDQISVENNGFLGQSDSVIPADDLLNGNVGFLLFRPRGDDEDSVLLQRKMFDVKDTMLCSTFDEYKAKYDDAYGAGHCMVKGGSPIKLRLGFIVIKRDGAYAYQIRVSEFKKGMAIQRTNA